ncbi:torsin-1a-interacting protein [Holotrichia oblita]|uniref:Torsin-1a-interacting protein n=1 Tax=Holotrichia oblita TaxID=644536 RepID=A0ACB9SRH3_HOLOL|nr:torsin-1a-interacting protein [Holotrichia oblita]
MKREGPGGSSTPSIVPKVKGRPPTCYTYDMVSPISANNDADEPDKRNSFYEENQLGLDVSPEDGANQLETPNECSGSSTSEASSEPEVAKDKLLVNDQCKEENILESGPKKRKHKTRQNLEGKFESKTGYDNKSQNKINTQTQARKETWQFTVKYINYLNIQQAICMFSILIFGVFAYNKLNTSETTISSISINEIKEIFPQDNSFWISIETGVMEITNFNKPSVIILLHKHNGRNFTELLDNITMYASCILNQNCDVKPIVIEGNDLNTHEMKQDYGIVIDHYSPLLNEKHIMVVKNMDDISGSVAQAFHYICDEFSPLVPKSLIIFTIKVNEYNGKALEQAVDILNTKWGDIEPDKLEPLITRVSSIVLHVK